MHKYPDTLESISKVIDRESIQRYAKISDDFNPIHVDPEFAANTPLGGIIAHGMLSLNLIWLSVQASLDRQACEGASLTVRFTRPVRENDRVCAHGQLIDTNGKYTVTIENQDGDTVIKGTLRLAQH